MAKTPEEKKAVYQRKSRGLLPVSTTLQAITQRALGHKGFAEGGLAREWNAIIGTVLARATLPVSLKFPKKGERRAGTLTLKVAPGFGPEIQMESPKIIERINAYFGYACVARLTLKDAPELAEWRRAELSRGKALADPPPAPLRPGIRDPELAQALARLEAAVKAPKGKP